MPWFPKIGIRMDSPGFAQRKKKSDNRLKRRNRRAFGAPVGFPRKIFYCQCRSSTLRATGTGVK